MNVNIAEAGPMRRFDDGIIADYAVMIRMWSAFDRSIAEFDRECGLPKFPHSERDEMRDTTCLKRS